MKHLLISLFCITAFAGCTKNDYLQDYRGKFAGRYHMTVRETLQYTTSGETVLDSTYEYDGFAAYGSVVNTMKINYKGNSFVEAQTFGDGKMEGGASHMYCSGEFYNNTLELEINYYTPGSRIMYYVTGLKYMPE